MKDYKRLTNNNLEEYDPEYDFCCDCKYFGEPNGCNRLNGTCDNYQRFNETYNRLAEIEDKIESGELISTQLKDSSEQEFAFFMNHNKSVRKLFADELKARLQDAVTLRNITRKVYDVIESEINYCLDRWKNERL